MSGSSEHWNRQRQYSRDLEENLRHSRDSSPDRDTPRNKTKRIKVGNDREAQILQFHEKVSDLLICTVCLANPNTEIYQCHYGHLMCIGCFYRLLADARIKDEQARCPKCRVDMSRNSCVRNLVVELLLSELLSDCIYCNATMSRNRLESHTKECKGRPVNCTYIKVGCTWTGASHSSHQHADECDFQHRPARDIIAHINKSDRKHDDQIGRFRSVTSFMSHAKLFFTDIVLSPHRTDDFIPQLFYESSKFNLFGHYWLVRGRVQGDEHNFQRTLSLKVVLKGKSSMEVEFCFTRDAYSTVDIIPEVSRHSYTAEDSESDYVEIKLVQPLDLNNLLAEKSIKFRLYMAQL
ncbi:zinc finger TRAF-type-containing protein 1-B-like isoform X1 [Bolinopsis microptera]|uniref:zinc finger TRAF-type-containing protein 1-B-like isoform X1 n=1 Tax=Bolinopsis microptera TaxID=2820187 RepID=UPI003078CDE4